MQKHILPEITQRVRLHTKEKINPRINNSTNENINYYKNKNKDLISLRIEKLNHELDIERVLETNAAIVTSISTIGLISYLLISSIQIYGYKQNSPTLNSIPERLIRR